MAIQPNINDAAVNAANNAALLNNVANNDAVDNIPAPAATHDDLVAAAMAKLSQTAVNNLWKKIVSDAHFLMKYSGIAVIQYYLFSGRSAAVEEDAAHGATIKDFNKKSTELVDAVGLRFLTQNEADKAGIPPLKFYNAKHQSDYDKVKGDAETKLKEFYDVFKTRVSQIGVDHNSRDYGIYAAAAQKLIEKRFQKSTESEVKKHPAHFALKIKTAQGEFNGKIFDDMADAYGKQAIGDITIESFQKKAALIHGFFPQLKAVDIEAKLREAIKAKHVTPEDNALEKIRGEFACTDTTGPTAARFLAAKTAKETELRAKKTALEAEYYALRGTDAALAAARRVQGHEWQAGCGTMHAASLEMQAAGALVDTAKAEYVTQRGQFPGQHTANDDTSVLLGLADADPRLVATKADLRTKFDAFEVKRKAFEALCTRFAKIAHYAENSERRDGGELFDVEANLDPTAIERSARAETSRKAAFYNELNQDVADEETARIARSEALRAIFNPNP
jgi:hypothetical protein